MKALIAVALLAVPAFLPTELRAQQEAVRPDVPNLTAKTARWSWNENIFDDEKGAQVSETVRIQGVDVEVYFTSRPQRAYEVQVFFFARNEQNGQPFIYDAHALRLQKQVHREVIKAEPLLGTTKRTERSTVVGTTDDGRGFVGEVIKNQSEAGAKVYGWIVRVISVGKVVRIESNQTSLKKLAQEQPDLLDDALVELESAAASKN